MDATGAGAAVEGRDGPAPVVEEEGGQQLVGEAGASVEEVDEEIEGSSVSLLPDEVKLDPEVQQAISQVSICTTHRLQATVTRVRVSLGYFE